MTKTFAQMERDEISSAHGVSPAVALEIMAHDARALLVDVRDSAEVRATGIGSGALHAPGLAAAWMGDLESPYRSAELQDRNRRILTTCGGAPSFRGASIANLLAQHGFTNVSFVDGGMSGLLASGIAVEDFKG